MYCDKTNNWMVVKLKTAFLYNNWFSFTKFEQIQGKQDSLEELKIKWTRNEEK